MNVHQENIAKGVDSIASNDFSIQDTAFAIWYAIESVRWLEQDDEGELAKLEDAYYLFTEQVMVEANIDISPSVIADRYRTARWLVNAKQGSFLKGVCYQWHATAASRGATWTEFKKSPAKFRKNTGKNSGDDLRDSSKPKFVSHMTAVTTSIKRAIEWTDNEARILDDEGNYETSAAVHRAKQQFVKALPHMKEAMDQLRGLG